MAGEKDVVIIYDPLDLELVKYVSGRITSVRHQQRNIPDSRLNSNFSGLFNLVYNRFIFNEVILPPPPGYGPIRVALQYTIVEE